MGNLDRTAVNNGINAWWIFGGVSSWAPNKDRLLQAAAGFIAALRTCVQLSSDAASGDQRASRQAYEVASRQRLTALDYLQTTAATAPRDFEAKLDVLLAMLDWLDFEDPRLARFAVQLAREQGDYIARKRLGPPRLRLSRLRGGSNLGDIR